MKVVCPVRSTALPIHFFRHFCYRGCNVRPQLTAKNPTAEISASGIAMAAWSPDAAFSAVRFCSYTVRHTQCDRPSWQQLRTLLVPVGDYLECRDTKQLCKENHGDRQHAFCRVIDQTDRWTTYNRNTALCTIARPAVKIQITINSHPSSSIWRQKLLHQFRTNSRLFNKDALQVRLLTSYNRLF